MKVVLTGAGGQLAHDLMPFLARAGELVALSRSELDICQGAQIENRLAELQPDCVVNTAAYNAVDRAECEPADAFAGNALGPRLLAQSCAKRDALLVHFSSDYVFGLDAQHAEPWTETDPPGPVNVYGCSKLAGEFAVRTYCEKHLVIRTCGLYGLVGSRGKGGNFVQTMLRLAQAGSTIRVVNDQTCTPSSTLDVARATVDLIHAGGLGVYHVTNSGACTWYEFAGEVFRQAGLSVDCVPITSSQYGATARRPVYSVLFNKKLVAAGVAPCPTWQEAVARYLGRRRGA